MERSQRNYNTNRIYCKYHPDAYIIEDYTAGDMICSACGLVLVDRVIDVSSEWNTNSNNTPENPLCSQDLTTKIQLGSTRGKISTDDNGVTKYSNKKNVKGSDRTLLAVFKIINTMSDKLNGQQRVVSTANQIFKKILDAKLAKGRSHETFAAACLYVAFSKERVPRTFKDICSVSSISATEIKRCFSKIMKNGIEKQLVVVKQQDYIPRFCGILNLPAKIIRIALHIATATNMIKQFNFRKPVTIAAAAIYLAVQGTEYQKSAKIIGEVCGVAERTIKNVYKYMQIYRAQLLPNKF